MTYLCNIMYCLADTSSNQPQSVKSIQPSTVIVSTHNNPLVINTE